MENFFDSMSNKDTKVGQKNFAGDPPIGEDVMMPMPSSQEHQILRKDQQMPLMGRKGEKRGLKGRFSWENISRMCIYLLFGLLPFWFLPFSAFPVDDAKIFLIALCALLAGISWLAQALSSGRIEIVRTKLWRFAIAFLVLAAISTVFSLSPSLSIWGSNHQPDTLFALLFGVILLFVSPWVFKEARNIKKAQVLLCGAAVIVAVESLFQFFGKYPLFFDFTRSTIFNVFGSLENLGVFLGLSLSVIVALLSTVHVRRVTKIFLFAGALFVAADLLFLNFSFVWLGLMVGFAIAASLQIVRSFSPKHSEGDAMGISGGVFQMRSQFALFILLMIVSAIILFVGIPVGRIVSLPPIVSPNFLTTLGVAGGMFHEGILRVLFGSGPGTFLYEYLAHRPDSINNTAFFALRFSQGFSFMTTLLVSLGVLGFLAMLSFVGYFLSVVLRSISRAGKDFAERGENVVSFVGLVFLLFSWFFYSMSTPLVILTFLFAGMLLAGLRNEGAIQEVPISFTQSAQAVFMFSFVAIVLLAILSMSAYWHVQKYAAAVVSATGVKEYNATNGKAIDDATSKVGMAATLDSSNDLYLRTLSQLFTVRALNVIQQSSSKSADVLQQNFQQEFQNATQAAHLAIAINDRDPLNWQALGDVYANLLTIVIGADSFAVDSYQKMVDRDPQNPVAYLTLAQAYVNASDALNVRSQNVPSQQGTAPGPSAQQAQNRAQAKDYLAKAQDVLNKAISLKHDYAPALYLLAQVYDREGNRTQAIENTRRAFLFNPKDIGIAYQLGLLYYLDGQFDLARQAFESAVTLNPNYSNARYFLGLTYDKQGQKDKALVQFQEVQKLNPGNVEVKQIIANLQAGKDALDGIVPPQQGTQTPVPQTGGSEPTTPLQHQNKK